MNAKETQAQTIKDEELELTKDYYAHHLHTHTVCVTYYKAAPYNISHT